MDIQQELKIAIAETRGGAGAGEITRKLLDNDTRAQILIGVFADGRIATWHAGNWNLCTFDIPEDDPIHLGNYKRKIEQKRYLFAVEQWLRQRLDEFYWLHPRFRWVTDIEDRQISMPDAESV